MRRSLLCVINFAFCILFCSCYNQGPLTPDAWDLTEKQLDSISFYTTHHYTQGYNFVVSKDSLPVLEQQQEMMSVPEILNAEFQAGDVTMPMLSMVDTIILRKHNRLVVADIKTVPADSIDSVWVKVARDQLTFGWVHESDLLANVSPDDPISQFIDFFSDSHLLIFLGFCVMVGGAYGLRRLAFLAGTLLVYYGVTLLALKLLGGHFETYGVEKNRSLVLRTAVAYSAFLHIFTRGYFGFIPTAWSRILHGLCALGPALLLLRWLLGEQPWSKRGLLLLCLFLLPLSIDCIYLIAELGVIYSPVMFGFVSVYLLAAVVVESDREASSRFLRSLLAASLALITLFNVYLANKAYLKMYLDYENAFAFYTGIAAQLRMTEGFEADSKIAILGEASTGLSHSPELDLGELVGPSRDLVNVYTREIFLQRYVGFDVSFADLEEKRMLQERDEVKQMPAYPNYGFIQNVGDYIVVKLG